MRIVHLSDIHLSKSNYEEFKNSYCEALIHDLINYDNSKKIDVIVITGDLVDKGGDSLYEIEGFEDKECYQNPYDIFEEIFINPIIKALRFTKENFLFIPGNHDIDENEILLKDEYELTKKIKADNINTFLKENTSLKYSQRIKKFKTFEERFHQNNSNYQFTNNQSTFKYNFKGINIGFILINDSWRCRSQKLKDEDDSFFFGVNQIYNGLNILKGFETKVNIALTHHSIDNFKEKQEFERCLKISNISFYLYGHYHSNEFKKHYQGSTDSCFGIRGRASLNKIEEIHSSYQPGYQIIDLDLEYTEKITAIYYRQYKYNFNHFDYDTDACLNGIDKGPSNNGIEILKNSKEYKKQLLNRELFESK